MATIQNNNIDMLGVNDKQVSYVPSDVDEDDENGPESQRVLIQKSSAQSIVNQVGDSLIKRTQTMQKNLEQFDNGAQKWNNDKLQDFIQKEKQHQLEEADIYKSDTSSDYVEDEIEHAEDEIQNSKNTSKMEYAKFQSSYNQVLDLSGDIKHDFERFQLGNQIKMETGEVKATREEEERKENCRQKMKRWVYDKKMEIEGQIKQQIIEKAKKKKKMDEDDEMDEDELNQKVPQINFRTLLENEKDRLSVEYPFSNVHVEDAVFINEYGKSNTKNIITLECTFLSSDCHYYDLELAKFKGTDTLNQKNRMCTENYKRADFENQTDLMVFDQAPLNLSVNQKESYVSRKIKEGKITMTKNGEANIMMYLAKWRVNTDGTIQKLNQSQSFTLQGRFRSHHYEIMQLNITRDGNHVYIVNKLSTKIEMLVWNTQTMEQVKIKNLERYLSQQSPERIKEIRKIKLICRNHFLVITERDHCKESQLEKFILVNLNDREMQEMSIDCRLGQNGKPKIKTYTGMKCVDEMMITKDHVYPLKVFVDYGSIKGPSDENYNYENEQNDLLPKQPYPKLKIIYILNQKLTYKDEQAKLHKGFPWTLVDIDLNHMMSEFQPQQQLPLQEFMINYLNDQANKVFQSGIELIQRSERLERDRNSKEDFTLSYKSYNDDKTPKFFMLRTQFISQIQDQTQGIDHNPIEKLLFKANQSFNKIAFISYGQKQEFMLYDATQEKKFDNSYHVKQKDNRGSLEFVRNQSQKLVFYCQLKCDNNETIVYGFYDQDSRHKKKSFIVRDNHEKTQIDCTQMSTSEEEVNHEGQIKIDELRIATIALSKNCQKLKFQTFSMKEKKLLLDEVQKRQVETQQIIAEYPCMATDLGRFKICIHLNINPLFPKAIIYDFNKLEGNDKGTKEQFVGFVQYNKFKDLGLDTSYLNLSTCSKFVYLTQRVDSVKKKEEDEDKVFYVRINILLVEAFNQTPQVAHFKSSKVYELIDNPANMDLIHTNLLFSIDDELLWIGQQSLNFFSLNLVPMLGQEKKKKEKINIDDSQSDIQSQSQPSYIAESDYQRSEVSSAVDSDMELMQEKGIKKEDDDFDLLPVLIFQDVNQLVYMVTRSKDSNSNQTDFRQYDPASARSIVLLTLRVNNILAFVKLHDGRFVIINEEGQIQIYSKNSLGNKLEKQGEFHIHVKDRDYITKNIKEFNPIFINSEVLVVDSHIIYLHENQSDVIEGILEMQDLREDIKSDFCFNMISGPIKMKGQSQIVEIFSYNDSNNQDYYLYQQRSIHLPNSKCNKLLHDCYKSCKFSTFLENGDIIGQFQHRFLRFQANGTPMGEIQFLGQDHYANQEDPDRIIIVVYWHEFICQNDTGLNKKVFFGQGGTDRNSIKDLINKEKQTIAMAKGFCQQKRFQENKVPYTMVMIDKNKGMFFLDHSTRRDFWHQKCVQRANLDYMQRYELIQVDQSYTFFIFYDNFLNSFALWQLTDRTLEKMTKFLVNCTGEKNWNSLQKKVFESVSKNIAITKYKNQEQINIEDVKDLHLLDDEQEQKPESYIMNMSMNWKFPGYGSKTDEDSTNFEDKKQKLIEKFPVLSHPPYKISLKKQKKFIQKYLQPVHLTKAGAELIADQKSCSWPIHNCKNLLNDHKTKFNCKYNEITLTMHFNKKSLQIQAFGFESANNFPHLDPEEISIDILTDEKNQSAEFREIMKIKNIKFKNRFEVQNYFNPYPHKKIKEIRFRISNTVQSHEDIKMQLSQILIYEMRTNIDFVFKKVFEIPLIHKNNNKGVFKPIYHKIRAKNSDQDIYAAEYIKQSNIVKHIQNKGEYVRVIFAVCDYDLSEEKKGYANIIGQFYDVALGKNVLDITHKQYSLAREHIFKETPELLAFYFENRIVIDEKKQIIDVQRISKEIELDLKFGQRNFILEDALPNYQRNSEILNKIKEEQRNSIYKYSSMIQLKFGEKFAVIKESQKVRSVLIEEILGSKVYHDKIDLNESQGFTYTFLKKKQMQQEKQVQSMSFSLPNQNSEIINIHFVHEVQLSLKDEKKEERLIQIQALDKKNQVLVLATWDIVNDLEFSMNQIKCEPDKNPKLQFFQGIQDRKTIKNLMKNNLISEDKNYKLQGTYNYLLQGDTVIDLYNNLPYFYSQDNMKTSEKYQITDLPYLKKVYKNSSRMLGIYKPHHLIFDHSLKQTQYWHDLCKKQSAIEILRGLQQHILPLFRIKFSGMSLFHHFAGNIQVQQVIDAVYEQFMKAKEQNQLSDESIYMMPLFLLGPDDYRRMNSLEIAITSKKPHTFELMVAMLRDFSEICSSKMMLSNFQNIVSLQALDYFEKSQFNPPLLRTPFTIQWPSDREQIVFTSETSLITESKIAKVLSKYHQDNVNLFFDIVALLSNILFEKINLQACDFDKILRCRCCFVCCRKKKKQERISMFNISNVSNDGNMRRITVDALDFDWIFEGENTLEFLKLLHNNASNTVFQQKTIITFVDLMWSHYRARIIRHDFIPYLIKLITLILLTSSLQLNYINQIKIYSHDAPDTIIQEAPENQDQLIYFQIFFSLVNLILSIQYLLRENKQFVQQGYKSYFLSFWNLWGLLTEGYNLTFLGMSFHLLWHIEDGISDQHQMLIRQVAAYAVFLQWVKTFYWMGLWPGPAYFLVQLSETFQAVRGFLIMFYIVIFAFANFFFIIQQNVEEGGWVDEDDPKQTYNYVEESIKNKYADALISMYLVSLGEFNSLDGYSGSTNIKSAWLFFLMATIILLLLFMNMLIAVMSERFEAIRENKQAFILKNQVTFIIDFQDLIDHKYEFRKQKYIMILKPEQVEEIESHTVEEQLETVMVTNLELKSKVDSIQNETRRMEDLLDKTLNVDKNVEYIAKDIIKKETKMKNMLKQQKDEIKKLKDSKTKYKEKVKKYKEKEEQERRRNNWNMLGIQQIEEAKSEVSEDEDVESVKSIAYSVKSLVEYTRQNENCQ